MDFDTLLKESVEYAKRPKTRSSTKKKVDQKTTSPKPRKKPLQPVAGEWINQAVTCLLVSTKCCNCQETYQRPEPHYFIRKTRKRKNANPDVHYERTSIHAAVNVYSNLPREVIEHDHSVEYCHHCWTHTRGSMQLPLDIDQVTPLTLDILDTLRTKL